MMSDVVSTFMKPKIVTCKSTSLKTAQDEHFTNRMNTTFKDHYPPHNVIDRTQIAMLPPLSDVMHKDAHFFNERQSETTRSFEYKSLAKTDDHVSNGKFRLTNFKMHRDLSKFNSFETMHNFFFTPKMENNYKMHVTPRVITNNFPQGDREKERLPQTDYKETFQGHDTTLHKTLRAPSMHHIGPPTIRGDDRENNFHTTHNDTFLGKYRKRVQTLSAPPTYNVPIGDPKNIYERETTMNASYKNVSNDHENKRFSMDEVSRVLNKTNFKQQDGHFKWNDYMTTATASYQMASVPFVKMQPAIPPNQSNIPEGDITQTRELFTTNQFYFGNPPSGIHSTIVSAANLRTKSNVTVGDPSLSASYYDTTHAMNFPAKKVPNTYTKSHYQGSNIPLDYYGKDDNNRTTATEDFQNPMQTKMILNTIAMANLKASHVSMPISTVRSLTTTHNDTYTPKWTEKLSYETKVLQKSSVPLGTMDVPLS